MEGNGEMKCGCMHHKSMPLLIILLGLDFLARTLGWVTDQFLAVSWPIIVMAIGFVKMGKGMCKCCK